MRFLLFLMLASLGMAAQAADPTAGTMTLTRVDAGHWRARYCFDTPVRGFEFTRAIPGMRHQSWVPGTGYKLTFASDGTASLQAADDEAFSCADLTVTPYYALPENDYYAFAAFSDGGTTLYTGYFTGSVQKDGAWKQVRLRASYEGRAGEQVLAARPDELGHQFVYFGPATAAQRGHADIIIDPALPTDLRDTILEQMPKAEAELAAIFGAPLKDRYQIFMAAADLGAFDGMSVKGGALLNQLRFTFKGRDVLKQMAMEPSYYPRLAIHEVVHLFQHQALGQVSSSTSFWVNEGGADAVTLELMLSLGLYTPAQYKVTWAKVRGLCEQYLETASVEEGPEQGLSDISYQCGATVNRLIGAALSPDDPGAGIRRFWYDMASNGNADRLSSSALYFDTMLRLGFSPVQIEALRSFLSRRGADIDKLEAVLKKR